jgi:hypothetical protein
VPRDNGTAFEQALSAGSRRNLALSAFFLQQNQMETGIFSARFAL